MQLDYATQQPEPKQGWDAWLVALVLIGLALRFGWCMSLSSDPGALGAWPDQTEYFELGKHLRTSHELGFVDTRFFEALRAYRMPGYPLFVAICGADLSVVRFSQALIGGSCILAVYLLARRWMDRPAARLGAALIAFNPFLIYFTGLILTETLFSAMLVWGMSLLLYPRRWMPWLLGLILLVLSIHVRPSAITLPLVLSIIAVFVNRGAPSPYDWRWSPPAGTLTLALTVATLLPWAWRNQQVVGSWIWTTTSGGVALYDGLNPNATGASDLAFVRYTPQLRQMDEVGRSQYLSSEAQRFAWENPVPALKLAVVKIGRTWTPIPLSSEYGTNPKLVAAAGLYMLLLYLLVFAGLWIGEAPKAAKVFLMAPAVYLTVVHAVAVGSVRYRLPADLPMAVVAGFALQFALSRRAAGNVAVSSEAPVMTDS